MRAHECIRCHESTKGGDTHVSYGAVGVNVVSDNSIGGL